MPQTLPPVDPNVKLPPSVLRAAEAANAAHTAAYGPEPAPAVQPATPEPAPAVQPATPEPAPAVQPAPAPVPAPEPAPVPAAEPTAQPVTPVAEGDFEHRYNSMRGRYEQSQRTIGAMQEQMAELGNEIVRLNQLITQPANVPQPPPPPLVTEEDLKTYGPELIDVVRRVATQASHEIVDPALNQVQQQNRQVLQRVQQQSQRSVYQTLDDELPNWREVNQSQRFKQWLNLPDLYSGAVRSRLLNDALRAGNAPRVVAFFRGFLAEEQATGNAPAPQQGGQQQTAPVRQAAVPLESLAAPGRAKPATGATAPAEAADKPIITRAQISAFYADVRRGVYNGRPDDKARDEAVIFAAQREGRVR